MFSSSGVLELVCTKGICMSSKFSDSLALRIVMLDKIAWHCSQWGCLHHGNWQTLQIWDVPHPQPFVKYLPSHFWQMVLLRPNWYTKKPCIYLMYIIWWIWTYACICETITAQGNKHIHHPEVSSWTFVRFWLRIFDMRYTHLLLCCVQAQSSVQLFVTPWTVAYQASLSVGFSRQEYWSGLSFPPTGDLPNPGIETESPALAGRFFTTEPPGKPYTLLTNL